MKVALITAFPSDPASPHGGVEAVSVNLARALTAQDDLDVHVVTQDRTCTDTTVTRWESATVHRLPRAKVSTLWNAIGPGRRQIREYISGLVPDLVHAHDVYGLMVKELRIPRVFTVHGFIYADTLVSGERFAWARSRLWRHFEVAGWADQPHIISISPYVRERLAGLTDAIIHNIDNPIAPDFFDLVREEREPPTIFSAAIVGPRKNTLALVEAVGRLVEAGLDVELRLAGSIADVAYGERLQALITERRLEDKVSLLGKLSSRQIRDELRRAWVFALVSLEENSPMGIEEAMAARVPVVTSNRCGMPYMVEHGVSGFLVDPLSPAAIADSLRTLLADPALRCRMSSEARDVARRRFHPEAVAQKTVRVYRDAARQSPNRSER